MSKKKEKERRRDAEIRRQIKKEFEDKLRESAARMIALEAALKKQEVEFRELKRQYHILQRKAEETEANPSSEIGLIFSRPFLKQLAESGQYHELEAETANGVEVQPETDAQEVGTTDLKPDHIKNMIFTKRGDLLEIYQIEPGDGGYNLFYSVANAEAADLAPAMEMIGSKAEDTALQLNQKPIVSFDEAQKLMYREAGTPDDDIIFL